MQNLRFLRKISLSLSLVISAVLALAFIASLFSPLQAQNTDEKIQALEKELRLLELQKQVEQAKKDNPTQTNNSTQNDTTTNPPTQTDTPNQPIYQSTPAINRHKSISYKQPYERSGSFIGIELGAGEVKAIANTHLMSGEQKTKGFKYGILWGYNKFFVKYFGIRTYLNANVTQPKDKDYDEYLYRLNYGLNLDLLANFVATNYFDLGAFVGLGVGGQTWLFTGQSKEMFDTLESAGVEVSYTGFDVGLNVGLRSNIARHLGIEVACRIPFVKTTIMDARYGSQYSKLQMQETYSIAARLLWNF